MTNGNPLRFDEVSVGGHLAWYTEQGQKKKQEMVLLLWMRARTVDDMLEHLLCASPVFSFGYFNTKTCAMDGSLSDERQGSVLYLGYIASRRA